MCITTVGAVVVYKLKIKDMSLTLVLVENMGRMMEADASESNYEHETHVEIDELVIQEPMEIVKFDLDGWNQARKRRVYCDK